MATNILENFHAGHNDTELDPRVGSPVTVSVMLNWVVSGFVQATLLLSVSSSLKRRRPSRQ